MASSARLAARDTAARGNRAASKTAPRSNERDEQAEFAFAEDVGGIRSGGDRGGGGPEEGGAEGGAPSSSSGGSRRESDSVETTKSSVCSASSICARIELRHGSLTGSGAPSLEASGLDGSGSGSQSDLEGAPALAPLSLSGGPPSSESGLALAPQTFSAQPGDFPPRLPISTLAAFSTTAHALALSPGAGPVVRRATFPIAAVPAVETSGSLAWESSGSLLGEGSEAWGAARAANGAASARSGGGHGGGGGGVSAEASGSSSAWGEEKVGAEKFGAPKAAASADVGAGGRGPLAPPAASASGSASSAGSSSSRLRAQRSLTVPVKRPSSLASPHSAVGCSSQLVQRLHEALSEAAELDDEVVAAQQRLQRARQRAERARSEARETDAKLERTLGDAAEARGALEEARFTNQGLRDSLERAGVAEARLAALRREAGGIARRERERCEIKREAELERRRSLEARAAEPAASLSGASEPASADASPRSSAGRAASLVLSMTRSASVPSTELSSRPGSISSSPAHASPTRGLADTLRFLGRPFEVPSGGRGADAAPVAGEAPSASASRAHPAPSSPTRSGGWFGFLGFGGRAAQTDSEDAAGKTRAPSSAAACRG